MVNIKRKNLTILSLFLSSILLIVLMFDLFQLLQIYKANSRIQNRTPMSDSDFYEEQFSLAEKFILEKKQEMALAVYNNIEQSNAPIVLKQESLYNSANIYFRAALNAQNDGDEVSALPNFELAKLTYRKCLNLSPSHLGARYNLERALIYSPEKVFDKDKSSLRPERGESAVTTMKLQAQGMP